MTSCSGIPYGAPVGPNTNVESYLVLNFNCQLSKADSVILWIFYLQATLSQARETKKSVHLMGISFGDWVDREELINTVSYPYEKNLFHVDTIDQLAAIKNEIRSHICNSE